MRKFLCGIVVFSMILAACTAKEEPPIKTETAADQEAIEAVSAEEEEIYEPDEVKYFEINAPRELTETEKELLRYPGKYSGDQVFEGKRGSMVGMGPKRYWRKGPSRN